ncbi:MAG: type IV pilus twitching motility protein PilT [Patescibacteria group bacterium]|jgi:twitching motility protein PilT
MQLQELLAEVIKQNASDLHITVGKPPTIRVDDKLIPIANQEVLTPETTENLVLSLLTNEQKEILMQDKEFDFSYAYNDQGRFRVNAYFQKSYLAASLRLIPAKVKTFEELNLPEILKSFASAQQGFFISCGPAGHGKTTTVAAMVDYINKQRSDHIITIEDPIEYTFIQDKCLIDQREVHLDTHSFPQALKSCLRQDPDVIFVGEMRDLETISTAATLAETGHLVLSTLHTNNAADTIDRMVGVFPPHQQEQIRFQLASSLLGMISQRLIPRIDKPGRIVVAEVLKINAAARNLIREGKTYQLNNIILTSKQEGMISLDTSLAELVKSKIISKENALAYAIDQKNLSMLL